MKSKIQLAAITAAFILHLLLFTQRRSFGTFNMVLDS